MTICSVVPYFKISDGKLDDFKELCGKLVEKTQTEEKCLYYGFSFDGDQVRCQEGFEDAAGFLSHLENVGSILEQTLRVSDLVRLEIYGPEEELKILREPLAQLKPDFFIHEYGFHR
jgi:quinol monooxygenase YgiN